MGRKKKKASLEKRRDGRASYTKPQKGGKMPTLLPHRNDSPSSSAEKKKPPPARGKEALPPKKKKTAPSL